jgi:proline iminopeptidase
MLSKSRDALFQAATAYPCEEVFVKTDNAQLYCRVIGKGEPLIVIHGGPGLSMDYLLPGLEQLAKDHLIIFYDQRGNGQSTGEINKETMNLSTFIDDLHTLQSHFKVQKTGLIGHSWGAYLAMSYAAKYPDQVNKLILLNSIPISFDEASLNGKQEQKDPYEAMIDAVIKSDAFQDNNASGMIHFYKDLFQYFFYNPQLVNQLNLDQMSAAQVKNSALIHKLFEEDFFHKSHDLCEQLAKLHDIPTLIVHGKGHDIPESVAHQIHSLIEGSTLAILECGHFPFVEQPKEFFECISKFNQDNSISPCIESRTF